MSQAGGMQVGRLDAIRSHLYAHGFSTIQALADSVGASLATIRRDLQVLERAGSIVRFHGGARIAEGSSVEMAFQEGRVPGPYAQALPDAVAEDETGVEHRHDGAVARNELAAHPDQDPLVARVILELVRAVGHGAKP